MIASFLIQSATGMRDSGSPTFGGPAARVTAVNATIDTVVSKSLCIRFTVSNSESLRMTWPHSDSLRVVCLEDDGAFAVRHLNDRLKHISDVAR
jgi:hypothetical protein